MVNENYGMIAYLAKWFWLSEWEKNGGFNLNWLIDAARCILNWQIYVKNVWRSPTKLVSAGTARAPQKKKKTETDKRQLFKEFAKNMNQTSTHIKHSPSTIVSKQNKTWHKTKSSLAVGTF